MLSEEQSCLVDICFLNGQQFQAAKQYQSAEYWYNRALQFDPENTEIHYALSYICSEQKRFEECAVHSTYAMKGRHGSIAGYNRALALLMLGKYKQGFIDYDQRLDFDLNSTSRRQRFGDLPYWSGESCDTLFISGEQGYGDIFQFSRYIPLVAEKFNVKKVYFEVPADCQKLFSSNFNSPSVEVVAQGPLPKIDYHIQLASLPRVFDTRIDTIPPLKLDPDCVVPSIMPKNRGGFYVGLVWSGRVADHDMQVTEWNNRRSIALEQLRPILKVKDVSFVSLQVGGKIDPEPKDFPKIEKPLIRNWSDTATILSSLDLLITIDSGVAHLAGAMQIPTWLLNHKSTCWRWLLSGPYTPWYTKNLEIFRQIEDFKWGSVIDEVAGRLEELATHRKAA